MMYTEEVITLPFKWLALIVVIGLLIMLFIAMLESIVDRKR